MNIYGYNFNKYFWKGIVNIKSNYKDGDIAFDIDKQFTNWFPNYQI